MVYVAVSTLFISWICEGVKIRWHFAVFYILHQQGPPLPRLHICRFHLLVSLLLFSQQGQRLHFYVKITFSWSGSRSQSRFSVHSPQSLLSLTVLRAIPGDLQASSRRFYFVWWIVREECFSLSSSIAARRLIIDAAFQRKWLGLMFLGKLCKHYYLLCHLPESTVNNHCCPSLCSSTEICCVIVTRETLTHALVRRCSVTNSIDLNC